MSYEKLICLLGGVVLSIYTYAQRPEEWRLDFEKVLYSNFDSAYQIAMSNITESEKQEDDFWRMRAYEQASRICYLKKDIECAQHNLSNALALVEQMDAQKWKAILYNRQGALHLKAGAFADALASQEKALRIARQENDPFLISKIHCSLGILYREQGNRERAFSQGHRAIKLVEAEGDSRQLANAYNLLGVLHFPSQIDSAEYYDRKALAVGRAIDSKYNIGTTLSNLINVHLARKDFPSMLSCLKEAQSLLEMVGDNQGLHYIHISFGNYYEYMDDYPSAIERYSKALREYGDYVNGYQKLNAYYLLIGGYTDTGRFEEAYHAQEEYLILKDSLFTLGKSREFEELRTQYDVERKNNSIALLRAENELIESQKKWGLITGLILLIPLLLLLLFYRQRIKNQRAIRQKESLIHQKEKERLEKEQELVQIKASIEGGDKERNRIAQELHDGIAGQLAGLNLGLTHLNENLKNEKIEKVTVGLSDIFKELRALSHNLSTTAQRYDDFENLLAKLRDHYEALGTFEIEISIFPEHCIQNMNITIKHHLYRIIQELLVNVARYAEAKSVSLSITKHNSELICMIEDDGKGFDPNEEREGLGLKNINERTKALEGKLTINSSLGKGTQVTLEIPINKFE